jgi:hypothetical protein
MARSFRIPAVLIAGAFLVLAAVVARAETGFAGIPAVQGDANCDGSVNPGDALSILLQGR